MKQNRESIISWLDFLRQFVPPTGLVLIGAGTGINPWVQYLQDRDYPTVVLVEADEFKFEQLKRVTSQQGEWGLRNQLIAPHEGLAVFHLASHSGESGLLKPESLRALWPNLTTRNEQTLQAITLKYLLLGISSPTNWMIVDCLPALPIIEGAGNAFDGVNVIVARVLHGESTQVYEKASLASLQAALEGCGFRILSLETSRHPGSGHALFVREPRTVESDQQIRELKIELNELKLSMKLQIDEVTKAEGQIALLRETSLHND